MKQFTLLAFFTIFSIVARAQFPENFDASCVTSGGHPSGWTVYNPAATSSAGRWACSSIKGRPATTGGTPTPGMMCTGMSGSTYNLDTSYLIPQALNLSAAAYPGGHVYLFFDTKKDNILVGGRLTVYRSLDTIVSTTTSALIDTPLLFPVFGNPDSTNWVTHQVDMSPYIGTGGFYIAFRYTSTTTTGTAWYLDNIRMSTLPLSVAKVSKDVLPIAVIGNSTSSQIALSYTAPEAGRYRIVICDMVGRKVYDEQVSAQAGTSTYTISGLNLHPGMYFVKMGNENTYGTTKLMIQ